MTKPERTRNFDDATMLAELTRTRLVAVVRGTTADGAVAAATVLFEAGVSLVEVTLTNPGAIEAIRRLRPMVPEGCRLGAGTVITPDQVAEIADAGAEFVVTPSVVPAIAAAVGHRLPVMAGAMTPTEAHTAHGLGAAVVKVFPASSVGPAHLRAIHGPFPDIPLVAVGGIGRDDVRPFLEAGAIAVGVGGPLVGDAASGGDLDALRRRAAAYLALTNGGSR